MIKTKPPTLIRFWALAAAFFILLLFSHSSRAALTYSGDFSQPSGAVADSGNGRDYGNAVVVDTFSAGGPYIYMVGSSSVGAKYQWAIIKYDGNGFPLASAFTNGFFDIATSATLDKSGNLIVGGFTSPTQLVSSITVVKYDPSLVFLASAAFSGISNTNDKSGLDWDSSGNLLFATDSSTGGVANIMVAKIDPNMVLLASATFNTGANMAARVIRSSGSFIYVAGGNSVSGNGDFLLLKYNSNLVLQSSATYDDSFGNYDSAYDLRIDSAGYFYLIGRGSTNIGHPDLFVVKADPNMVMVASSTIGANFYHGDAALLEGGDLYVAGDDTDDIFLARYSTADLTLISSVTLTIGNGFEDFISIGRGAGNYAYLTGAFQSGLAGLRYVYHTIRVSLPSFTAPASASFVARPYTAVTSTTLTANWSSGFAASTTYYAQLSTGAFPNSFTGNLSSNTFNAFTGFGSLNANTTYYAQVATAPAGPFASLGSTSTLAALGFILPPGCVTGLNVKKDGTADYTTIQNAVNSLSHTLAADSCVVIRDTNTYSEQINIETFANNSYFLKIMADPSFISSAPTLSPPSSSMAAFIVRNDSVTIQNINIIATNPISWGILASSAQVTISSVNIFAAGSFISVAGVSLSSWSSVLYSSINVQTAHGLMLTGSHNLVLRSTMTDNVSGYFALYLFDASSNAVTQSYISNPGGIGAYLTPNANYNSLNQDAISSVSGFAALEIDGSSNTLSQDVVSDGGSYGAILFGAKFTTISQSTITGSSAGYYGLYINNASSNTVSNSYIQGSTAVYISASTGTAINSSFLAAASAAGYGLYGSGGVGLALSGNTIAGGSGGGGILLGVSNSGTITLSSNTVQGAPYGLIISTISAGASLSVASMTFQSLTAGATAIDFRGGPFVSTFSNVNFADPVTAINVNGSLLAGGSRITMSAAGGAKAGPCYENDPSSLVDWLGLGVCSPAITPVAFSAVAASSVTANWTSTFSNGTLYYAQLSTGAFPNSFGGNASSNTPNLFALFNGLNANTSYYAQVATAAAGPFTSLSSALTMPSTPTAGSPLFSFVQASSLTANWGAGSNPNSGNLQYSAQMSTSSFPNSFSGNASTVTAGTSINFSSSVAPNTTYFFQVAAVNASGSSAFISLGSTSSLAALPSGVAFGGVALNSISLTWSSSANGLGTSYTVLYSTAPNPSAPAGASVTSSSTLGTSLTATGLNSATTYYFQVNAINNNGLATIYTSPISTATPASGILTPAAFSGVSASSLTENWTSTFAGGTTYYAQLSTGTFPNSFSGNLSSSTANLSVLFGGLNANTSYFAQVGTAPAGPFASLGSVLTLPSAPATGSPLFTFVQISSLTANWTAGTNPNPGNLGYTAQISTGAFPNAFSGNVSTVAAALSVNFSSAISPNTTYYFQVNALNAAGSSAFISMGSTSSLAAQPSGLGFGGVSANAITLSWSSSGNGPGASYKILYSTAPNPSSPNGAAVISSATLNTSLAASGLNAGTSYYFQVNAANNNGLSTLYTSAVSTVTSPNPILAAGAFSGVSASTLTASWVSGFSAGTLYYAQLSTGAFPNAFAGNASSNTANLFAAFGALNANTTYFAQVATAPAGPFAALGSTTTYPSAPGAGSPIFSAVQASSLTVNWTVGSNPNPGALKYTAQISTGAFPNAFSGNASTATSALSFNFNAAITPNSAYYLQVNAVNISGAGAFASLGSTITLAMPPAATTVLSAAWTAASVAWQANGNPASTNYELWQDTSSAFPNAVKSTLSTTSASLSGLAANTTYYFKVRAVNGGGIASLFDSTVSTKTMALPTIPGAPGTVIPSVLGTSSIAWNWAAAPAASSYNLYAASAPGVLLSSGGAAIALTQTALSSNTAYGLIVAGVNATGVGPASTSPIVYTLAAAPSGTVASNVKATSATVSWLLNGNPANTIAEIQRSTNNAVFVTASTAATITYLDASLIGCTTYYYRVRNRNLAGVLTAFDGTINFTTLGTTPTAPGGLSAHSLEGNRIRLEWKPSPTEGIVQYRLYYDAGAGNVNFASPLAVLTSTQTSYNTDVIISSPSYAFVLRAVHRCGVEETTGVSAAAASIGNLASVRASITTPTSGKHISGNRVSMIAELAAGTPAQTQKTLFPYRPSGTGVWLSVVAATLEHQNPAVTYPYLIQWNVTALAPGAYDLRAIAYNIAGTSDTAPSAIAITVDPANPDIDENDDGHGKVEQKQVVNSAVSNTVQTSGSLSSDPVSTIVLPAGVFNGSTTTVTTVCNPKITTAPPAGLTAVGSAVKIDLSNGQHILNGTAEVTLTYPDDVAFPSRLSIYSLDEATGLWTNMPATVNTDSHTITCNTPHFSIFAVIAGGPAPMQNLDTVRAYPVPWKPNGANPDEGKPFTAGDDTSGIIFDHLTFAVTIKIYSLRGRLVAKFETSAGTGAVRWDGTNLDGRDAQSGGYLAVISAPGLKSVVKKLAIIR